MNKFDIEWWNNYTKEELAKYLHKLQPITRQEADLLDRLWVKTDEGYQLAVVWIAIKGPDTTGVEGWFVRRGEVVPIKGYSGELIPVDKKQEVLYKQILDQDRSGKEERHLQ